MGCAKVNLADLTKWRGDVGLGAGSDADGDLDSDGNDFLLWQRHLGEGTGASGVAASGTVPEPAGALLMLMAIAGGALQRVRTRGRA